MDAKKCDRCGDFFNASDKDVYILNYKYKDSSGNFPFLATNWDLCQKCSKDFNKFIKKEII